MKVFETGTLSFIEYSIHMKVVWSLTLDSPDKLLKPKLKDLQMASAPVEWYMYELLPDDLR